MTLKAAKQEFYITANVHITWNQIKGFPQQ